THSEICSLMEDFSQLEIFYQPENDYEIKMKEVLETNDLYSENIYDLENEKITYFDNPVLTPSQIKKFQKIFSQNTIEENNEKQEVNEKLTIILDQQEKEAFIHKLRTT
ncbi:28577_t:CDS:1, partial [Dentiscutata erythropus]